MDEMSSELEFPIDLLCFTPSEGENYTEVEYIPNTSHHVVTSNDTGEPCINTDNQNMNMYHLAFFQNLIRINRLIKHPFIADVKKFTMFTKDNSNENTFIISPRVFYEDGLKRLSEEEVISGLNFEKILKIELVFAHVLVTLHKVNISHCCVVPSSVFIKGEAEPEIDDFNVYLYLPFVKYLTGDDARNYKELAIFNKDIPNSFVPPQELIMVTRDRDWYQFGCLLSYFDEIINNNENIDRSKLPNDKIDELIQKLKKLKKDEDIDEEDSDEEDSDVFSTDESGNKKNVYEYLVDIYKESNGQLVEKICNKLKQFDEKFDANKLNEILGIIDPLEPRKVELAEIRVIKDPSDSFTHIQNKEELWEFINQTLGFVDTKNQIFNKNLQGSLLDILNKCITPTRKPRNQYMETNKATYTATYTATARLNRFTPPLEKSLPKKNIIMPDMIWDDSIFYVSVTIILYNEPKIIIKKFTSVETS